MIMKMALHFGLKTQRRNGGEIVDITFFWDSKVELIMDELYFTCINKLYLIQDDNAYISGNQDIYITQMNGKCTQFENVQILKRKWKRLGLNSRITYDVKLEDNNGASWTMPVYWGAFEDEYITIWGDDNKFLYRQNR